MQTAKRPIALLILDGWGYREEKKDNAIAHANIPFWDHLWETYPKALISGSGKCVGLPNGQMGNSEVGHLNIGAGRIVSQDLTRIDDEISNGEFFKNPVLENAIQQAIDSEKAIHILGLVSDGGVHSHERHIEALLELAAKKNASKVYVHAFLDGRDTPPKSAKKYLEKIEDKIKQVKCGKIASIVGRFYAMDRDRRWERIEKTYDLLTSGISEQTADSAIQALELSYANDETDEFVKPTSIATDGIIKDGDSVIFMNFRADRAREITKALSDNDFNDFDRKKFPKVNFYSLTEYDKNFKIDVAYPPESLHNILGEYLSENNYKQLRIAETEKYAHVTFFFNGGIEKPFKNEDRILVPSQKVRTYDLKPEMSAVEVTDKLVEQILKRKHDVIICNFANPDMVGHTGNFDATVKAIETIDKCLERIINALKSVNGEALITADHGNAEIMYDHNTEQAHTAHTSELVPFLFVGRDGLTTKQNGKLSDIAPTILYLLGAEKPEEMTGDSLVE